MIKYLVFLMGIFLILPFQLLAQSDGSSKLTETPLPDSTSSPRATEPPSSGSDMGTSVPAQTTGVSRTVAPSPSPMVTSIVTPAPKPSSSSSINPTPSVLSPMTMVTPPAGNTAQVSNNWVLGSVIGLLASISAGVGFVMYKGKTQKKNDKNDPDSRSESRILDREADRDRCGSIKELLEQKKKELEDMVRNWPEEKIKAMAKDKVIGELKKNEDAKRIIETAESLKAKHDKLKETIKLLEKKYNLCTLEFPFGGKQVYKGTIVENSLHDKKILEDVKITKTYADEDWTLHDILIGGEKIDKLGQYLADGPWYMHLWQEDKDDVIIVFKDKNFKIKYSDKSTWTEAVAYGRSKGIPEEQFDFKIQ